METQKAFGRRAMSRPQPARLSAIPPVQSAGVASDDAQDEWIAPPSTANFPMHDEELEEWKRNRKFQIPWRQLSFMASLCFGIASLVLPDSVNDKVEWLLYALMAISFFAGLSRRRQKTQN
jgi:hypothetical protein